MKCNNGIEKVTRRISLGRTYFSTVSMQVVNNVSMWAILHYLNETFGGAKTETFKQLYFILFYFIFYSCTVHLDTVKVIYLPTDEQ